jgi:hypothetical protein
MIWIWPAFDFNAARRKNGSQTEISGGVGAGGGPAARRRLATDHSPCRANGGAELE